MTVKDIFDFLNAAGPFSLAEEWDNSGLIIGELSTELTSVTVALDATDEAVAAAAYNHSELLITHHPIIFGELHTIAPSSPVYAAIREGIAVIGFHTCFDNADYSVSDALAARLELSDVQPCTAQRFMRIGDGSFSNGDELARFVQKKLGGSPRYYSSGKPIRRIAVVGGAGEHYITDAAAAGADAYVTGEGSHHDFLLARELGLTFIAAGHYETENPAVQVLYSLIKELYGELSVNFFDSGSPVKY